MGAGSSRRAGGVERRAGAAVPAAAPEDPEVAALRAKVAALERQVAVLEPTVAATRYGAVDAPELARDVVELRGALQRLDEAAEACRLVLARAEGRSMLAAQPRAWTGRLRLMLDRTRDEAAGCRLGLEAEYAAMIEEFCGLRLGPSGGVLDYRAWPCHTFAIPPQPAGASTAAERPPGAGAQPGAAEGRRTASPPQASK